MVANSENRTFSAFRVFLILKHIKKNPPWIWVILPPPRKNAPPSVRPHFGKILPIPVCTGTGKVGFDPNLFLQ